MSGEHVASAIGGELIEEDAVETRPERIPAKIADELVDVFRVRRFFTTAAWAAVNEVIERKRVDPQWMCPICDRDADDSSDTGNVSIACDCCLEWFHLSCLGKKSRPKTKTWICVRCCRDVL